MAIITKAKIDLADCRTTLYYFDKAIPAPRLPLTSSQKYIELHRKTESTPRPDYMTVAPGAPAVLLGTLAPVYRKNKYWDRITQYDAGDDFEMYSGRAWEKIIPLAARIKSHVEFAAQYAPNMKVSPIPRILIYPFGWSAWLSLQITGIFDMDALAKFLPFILETKAFKITQNGAPDPGLYTLSELFGNFAKGVRTDAFAGRDTADYKSEGLIAVTTVMAKHEGSVAAGDFKDPSLLRIVKPDGPPPKDPEEYFGKKQDALQYILMNGDMRFIWLDDLLKAKGESHSQLNCYHNNNFLSMVHARHLISLLGRALTQKEPSAELTEVENNARNLLKEIPYQNAGLKRFFIDNKIPERAAGGSKSGENT